MLELITRNEQRARALLAGAVGIPAVVGALLGLLVGQLVVGVLVGLVAGVAFASSAHRGAAAAAEGPITAALGKLFALAEAYPDLKADANFRQLQSEITATEDRIAYARQFYNDSVLRYNNKLQTFPTVVIAGMFNFTKREFFEADEAARTVPTVQF